MGRAARERNCQHLGNSGGTSAKARPGAWFAASASSQRESGETASHRGISGWGWETRFFASVFPWRESRVLQGPPQQQWASFPELLALQARHSNPKLPLA